MISHRNCTNWYAAKIVQKQQGLNVNAMHLVTFQPDLAVLSFLLCITVLTPSFICGIILSPARYQYNPFKYGDNAG